MKHSVVLLMRDRQNCLQSGIFLTVRDQDGRFVVFDSLFIVGVLCCDLVLLFSTLCPSFAIIFIRRELMRGSRNFLQGGGGGGGVPCLSHKKSSDNVFFFLLVINLFYRSQMVYFKENYAFQGSRGGPTFSRGGGGSNFFRGCPIANSL